jgi:Flp pilus assembly protein TadG
VDTHATDGRLRDRGVSSVQFVLASGLALLLFLGLANLVVVQYGRGALRSALDQGARVGAISASTVQCEQRVADVLGQLLGGRMGDGITASCQVGPGIASATGQAVFVSWTPFAPDFHIEMTAMATRELPR